MKHFFKVHFSIFIWLLFYLFFLAFLFEINKKTFIIVTIIHIISIVVALTPIGEAIVRLLLGVRKLRINKETVHLKYLFDEVYKKSDKKIQCKSKYKAIHTRYNNDKWVRYWKQYNSYNKGSNADLYK